MGCHRKQSPTRISRRLPGIAVPALAGVAAAFCLAPQALADPSPAQGTANHAVVADAASRLSPSAVQLLSVIKQTEQRQAGSGQASWYTVKAGDSLSAIAERSYHNEKAWPVLYWANRSRIHWANVIEAGQVLRIPVEPARIPAPPALLGPASIPMAETAAPQATPASASAQGAVGDEQQRDAGRVVRSVRDCPRVRRSDPGHELDRPLRPLPVQRVYLGRVRRFSG